MCGIIVTNDSSQLMNLYEANASRGKHSFSFCALDHNNEILMLVRSLGMATALQISEWVAEVQDKAKIYIMHNQAPTTEARTIDNVHPYHNEAVNSYTWHNGILKPDFVKKLRPYVTWDTIVLSDYLNNSERNKLSEVDGSFAFVHLVKENGVNQLLIGRNEICPLFFSSDIKNNKKFYISSVKAFSGMNDILPGRVIYLHNNGMMVSFGEDEFKTYEMPYYLGDE